MPPALGTEEQIELGGRLGTVAYYEVGSFQFLGTLQLAGQIEMCRKAFLSRISRLARDILSHNGRQEPGRLRLFQFVSTSNQQPDAFSGTITLLVRDD